MSVERVLHLIRCTQAEKTSGPASGRAAAIVAFGILRRCSAALLLLYPLITGCPIGDVLTRQTRDFSDFVQFTFEQRPGLGFCPMEDSVFQAEIVVNEVGDFVFNASVLEQGQVDVDDCMEDLVLFGPCFVETPLEERILAPSEVVALREVFSRVVINNQAGVCGFVFIDPCVLNRFTWDAFSVNDFLCADSYVSSGPLLELLEQLRNAAVPIGPSLP